VIRAVVSDFGGVLTAPLMLGFARIQDHTDVPPAAFGAALARAADANGRNPLFELEIGAISEAQFLATIESELTSILERPVSLHGFGERYMAALDPNEELFAYYRGLHERGMRFAMLTNNVREWEPLWRAKLPVDEIFELVVDSAFVGMRKPDPAIYELTLDRLGGVEPTECLFVDDNELNVEAGRELGMLAIQFSSTEQAVTDIRAALGLA
jgi:putative hydrolase of the HAD superfamily